MHVLLLNIHYNYDCLQVSTNGLISFRSPFPNSYLPERFSAEFKQFEFPIIAPLWDDYYNSGEAGNVFYRVTRNSSDLQIISSLIANNSPAEFATYSPSMAVVVTWLYIQIRSEGSSNVSEIVV